MGSIKNTAEEETGLWEPLKVFRSGQKNSRRCLLVMFVSLSISFLFLSSSSFREVDERGQHETHMFVLQAKRNRTRCLIPTSTLGRGLGEGET